MTFLPRKSPRFHTERIWRMITISRTMTRTSATSGMTTASMEVMTDPASSPPATAKFPNPNVVPEDSPRTATVPICTTAAVPPPAMMAMVHLSSGEMSVSTEAVSTMPAPTAAGVAMTSRALSSQGMKYAPTSTMVATAKTASAG